MKIILIILTSIGIIILNTVLILLSQKIHKTNGQKKICPFCGLTLNEIEFRCPLCGAKTIDKID